MVGDIHPCMFAHLCAASHKPEEENFSYSLTSHSESCLGQWIPLGKILDQVLTCSCYQTMKKLPSIFWCQNPKPQDSGFEVGLLISVLYFPLEKTVTHTQKKHPPLSVSNLSSQVYLGKIKET